MKVWISDSAYSDLESIKLYYEEEGVPHIGIKFIEDVVGHVQVLVTNPDIGRVVPEFGEKGIRELIHPPFRIVYLREDDCVHVIRVWRSERLLKLPDAET